MVIRVDILKKQREWMKSFSIEEVWSRDKVSEFTE
jgi:hypothetical protein